MEELFDEVFFLYRGGRSSNLWVCLLPLRHFSPSRPHSMLQLKSIDFSYFSITSTRRLQVILERFSFTRMEIDDASNRRKMVSSGTVDPLLSNTLKGPSHCWKFQVI